MEMKGVAAVTFIVSDRHEKETEHAGCESIERKTELPLRRGGGEKKKVKLVPPSERR